MPTYLLRAGGEEAEHAPEFRYLRSWVELQARRALGDVRCPEDPWADPLALLAPEDRALVLAGDRVLVTARTLALLAATLDRETVEIAAPRDAAKVLAELPDPPPLYTLRGFERLEQRVLATPDSGDGTADAPPRRQTLAPDALPPVMLVTRRGLERVLRAPLGDAPAGPGDEIPLVRAGLYHEFIDYYGVERSDVLPHVPDGVRRVLEVGCGRGLTGELLRRERGARVTGVELNPVVAREAEGRLDRVVTGDVEDPELEAEIARGGPYDLVLALELFEHLAYPEEFLRRAAGWLADGGTILLSTPNVGHYSVVEDLLAGRWDYLPIGLLCYTHLRFFTRRTLEDWLGRLGLGDFRLIPQLTEGSERLDALSRSPETGSNALPPGLELDRESLRTQGFYVVIRPRADAGGRSGLRDGTERGNRPAADT
jgi:2-polyprenyl-3-methyl-5-hydroxy-6-metoxy-1,4-benzoquinol methylase